MPRRARLADTPYMPQFLITDRRYHVRGFRDARVWPPEASAKIRWNSEEAPIGIGLATSGDMPQSTSCPAHLGACVELAGFAAAQAVCCLFDRVPFAPLGFTRHKEKGTTLTFMSGGTPAQISAANTRWLDANIERADTAVIVCDAFVTMAGVRTDALVLEGRSYEGAVSKAKLAVPYRAHHHPNGFAIYRPKFIVTSLTGHDVVAFRQCFFTGVALHEAGRRVWDACADESW